jgi:hypothetical protein
VLCSASSWLVPVGAGRQLTHEINPSPEMGDRLGISRSRAGELPRLKPIVRCLSGQSGLGVVMRQEFGSGCRDLGIGRLKGLTDACVQVLAWPAQQRGVRGVLHERVLKAVARFGRRAAAEYEAGTDKLLQSLR